MWTPRADVVIMSAGACLWCECGACVVQVWFEWEIEREAAQPVKWSKVESSGVKCRNLWTPRADVGIISASECVCVCVL